jgi:hypothetical protein
VAAVQSCPAAAATLDGFDRFDAAFFGFSPKEAAILDPEHRQFLEVACAALEDAGHRPGTVPGPVGVFASCGMGSCFYFNLCSNPDLLKSTGMFLLRHTGNAKGFLATRVSHIFDLKGAGPHHPDRLFHVACRGASGLPVADRRGIFDMAEAGASRSNCRRGGGIFTGKARSCRPTANATPSITGRRAPCSGRAQAAWSCGGCGTRWRTAITSGR